MANTIKLPDLTIDYNFTVPANDLLMIAGGRMPTTDWLTRAATTSRNTGVWCIDHGIDACHEAGITPALLLGDCDSAVQANWLWAERLGIPVSRFNVEKDLTDTQLAIERAAALPDVPYVILSGSLGGRMDHLYSTLFSFANSDITGCLADHKETVVFLKSDQQADFTPAKHPKAISLLPLTKCTGITAEGVHWPLNNATIKPAKTYTVSNGLAADHFRISITEGIVAVYICWYENYSDTAPTA